jgi:hypothetical protein
MRTHGAGVAMIVWKETTLSSTMASGASSSRISARRGWTYFAPSISAWKVGAMNSPSCSIEVDPELAGDLGLRGRRAEAHEPLLEAALLEAPGERLLHDEHHAMAALAQHSADARAVVGRPVGALGEEHDRLAVGHRCHLVWSVVGAADDGTAKVAAASPLRRV